jgi:hypothetical protein
MTIKTRLARLEAKRSGDNAEPLVIVRTVISVGDDGTHKRDLPPIVVYASPIDVKL